MKIAHLVLFVLLFGTCLKSAHLKAFPSTRDGFACAFIESEKSVAEFVEPDLSRCFKFTFLDGKTLLLKIVSVEQNCEKHLPFDDGLREPRTDKRGHLLCPFVKKLTLRGVWLKYPHEIGYFCTKLENLEEIDLSGCKRFLGLSLKTLVCSLPKLRVLNLSGCESLVDYDMQYIVVLGTLDSLSLRGTKITDRALVPLLYGLMALEALDLRDCLSVSEKYRKLLGKEEIDEFRKELFEQWQLMEEANDKEERDYKAEMEVKDRNIHTEDTSCHQGWSCSTM